MRRCDQMNDSSMMILIALISLSMMILIALISLSVCEIEAWETIHEQFLIMRQGIMKIT